MDILRIVASSWPLVWAFTALLIFIIANRLISLCKANSK